MTDQNESKSSNKSSPNWGGKRDGSGRKPISGDKKRVPVHLTLDHKSLARLDIIRGSISRGQFLDRLILSYKK